MIRSIYVAATSQHVGKTTSTLGLANALCGIGINVGYCKPVGQEFLDLDSLQVDKDALLFSKVMDFKIASDIHSPVILGKGATTAYLDNPTAFDYPERIRRASRILQAENDIVIYEGTGHPGVGSVVDLSNADVAKMLGASVIMVVEGGIGNTLDRLSLSLSKFSEQDVPVVGVIVNKVIPEKLEKVRHYVGRKLDEMGIALMGLIPYDRTLSNPIMATILYAVRGRVLRHEVSLDNRVEDYLSGSLIDQEKLLTGRNLLLVVSQKRLPSAIERIQTIAESRNLDYSPISGVLITGDGFNELPVEDMTPVESYLDQYQIPVLTTRLDPLGSVIKISHIEVKINTRTPWKAERAIQLVRENVNLDPILRRQEVF